MTDGLSCSGPLNLDRSWIKVSTSGSVEERSKDPYAVLWAELVQIGVVDPASSLEVQPDTPSASVLGVGFGGGGGAVL